MSSDYFGISPLLIRPDTAGPFPVFLRQENGHVLYTRADERFTVRHKNRLLDNGVEQVFVGEEYRDQYESYVRKHLGDILDDASIPAAQRGETLYNASRDVLKESFHEEITGPFKPESYELVADLVRQSVAFLSTPQGLKAVAPLIRRDYETYTHCLHSFAYSTALLGALGLEKEELHRCGVGALLHDLGKLNVPEVVLHKPGPLTREERKVIQTHPLHGVSMLSGLNLPREAFNNVLFHHERMDGTGYPSGMLGEDIPMPVRVLTACDVFDALSSHRCYAKARTPFESLSLMREKMLTMLDVEVFKGLVGVLSEAGIARQGARREEGTKLDKKLNHLYSQINLLK